MTEETTQAQTATQPDEAAALGEATLRREAARRLGQARSERKAAAVRANGQKGGRPPGTRTSDEAKARMQAAQQRRRAGEKVAAEKPVKDAKSPPRDGAKK